MMIYNSSFALLIPELYLHTEIYLRKKNINETDVYYIKSFIIMFMRYIYSINIAYTIENDLCV